VTCASSSDRAPATDHQVDHQASVGRGDRVTHPEPATRLALRRHRARLVEHLEPLSSETPSDAGDAATVGVLDRCYPLEEAAVRTAAACR
jgi:hypothetical protein